MLFPNGIDFKTNISPKRGNLHYGVASPKIILSLASKDLISSKRLQEKPKEKKYEPMIS